MKLIFCPSCQDVVKLHKAMKTCKCGKSWGWYKEDGLHATIGGETVPIGFDNLSFTDALRNGGEFTAFVIAMPCDRIQTKGSK